MTHFSQTDLTLHSSTTSHAPILCLFAWLSPFLQSELPPKSHLGIPLGSRSKLSTYQPLGTLYNQTVTAVVMGRSAGEESTAVTLGTEDKHV